MASCEDTKMGSYHDDGQDESDSGADEGSSRLKRERDSSRRNRDKNAILTKPTNGELPLDEYDRQGLV